MLYYRQELFISRVTFSRTCYWYYRYHRKYYNRYDILGENLSTNFCLKLVFTTIYSLQDSFSHILSYSICLIPLSLSLSVSLCVFLCLCLSHMVFPSHLVGAQIYVSSVFIVTFTCVQARGVSLKYFSTTLNRVS